MDLWTFIPLVPDEKSAMNILSSFEVEGNSYRANVCHVLAIGKWFIQLEFSKKSAAFLLDEARDELPVSVLRDCATHQNIFNHM